MIRRAIDIPTPDGSSPASLHLPVGPRPWPAVVLYADAGGLRDEFRAMGDGLATRGYVTLVPDFYYRAGDHAPFDMRTLLDQPAEVARIKALSAGLDADMIARDAGAYIDYLLALPETGGAAVGTTGYCLGGRLSLIVAGHHGSRIAAAASFHGGHLAEPDDPSSPHLRAAHITAAVYVAVARHDPYCPPEQADRLAQALSSAGVDYQLETYEAHHGFAVADNPSFDEPASDRHWSALDRFFHQSWLG